MVKPAIRWLGVSVRQPGTTPRVLLSAHRLGVGWGHVQGGLRTALADLAARGVEYVEFDVQRSADGIFFAFHDAHLDIDGRPTEVATLTSTELAGHLGEVVRYEVLLEAIAHAGLRAHLDFKFVSPHSAYDDPDGTAEVAATRLAVEIVGQRDLVVTTRHGASVAAIRAWADREDLSLEIGLSLGRGVGGMAASEAVRTVLGELFPAARIERSRATVVVANHYLARLTLARLARRRGLKLLVWTVDSPRGLRYWLTPGRAWMVTSNEVSEALSARGRARRRG